MCEYHRETSVAFLCTPTDCHVIPQVPLPPYLFSRLSLLSHTPLSLSFSSPLFLPSLQEASDAMGANMKRIPLWQSLFRMLSFGKCLKKNQMAPFVFFSFLFIFFSFLPLLLLILINTNKNSIKAKNGKDSFYLVDGIVTAQGPNYALAKRIQHWRVIVAREAGHTTRYIPTQLCKKTL